MPSRATATTFQKRARRLDARLPRSADLEDEAVRHAAAREWTRWEMATSYLIPKASAELKADDLQFAVAFARIECHYFTNGVFMPHNFILDHVDRLSDIPIDIVQGRYDVVCPAEARGSAHRRAAQPLHIIGDAGHSMTEPPIAAKLWPS